MQTPIGMVQVRTSFVDDEPGEHSLLGGLELQLRIEAARSPEPMLLRLSVIKLHAMEALDRLDGLDGYAVRVSGASMMLNAVAGDKPHGVLLKTVFDHYLWVVLRGERRFHVTQCGMHRKKLRQSDIVDAAAA